MKMNKPLSIEEWLEANHKVLLSIDEKLTKKGQPVLADLGLINTRDLCLLLAITEKTVAGWRKRDEIRYTKKGRRYYYLLADVKAMLHAGFTRK